MASRREAWSSASLHGCNSRALHYGFHRHSCVRLVPAFVLGRHGLSSAGRSSGHLFVGEYLSRACLFVAHGQSRSSDTFFCHIYYFIPNTYTLFRQVLDLSEVRTDLCTNCANPAASGCLTKSTGFTILRSESPFIWHDSA